MSAQGAQLSAEAGTHLEGVEVRGGADGILGEFFGLVEVLASDFFDFVCNLIRHACDRSRHGCVRLRA